MIVLTTVLVAWVVLSVPAGVLMGKCIARGLAPAPAPAPVDLPDQRGAAEDTPARAALGSG